MEYKRTLLRKDIYEDTIDSRVLAPKNVKSGLVFRVNKVVTWNYSASDVGEIIPAMMRYGAHRLYDGGKCIN